MPKVVSRFVISSSEQSKGTKTSRAVLRSYYCLCGDFVLVMQGRMARLPRRTCPLPPLDRPPPGRPPSPLPSSFHQGGYAISPVSTTAYSLLLAARSLQVHAHLRSDGSYIIRSKDTPQIPARKFKLNAQTGDKFLLQRKDSDKMELRQTFLCGRCGTTVAYQTTSPPAGSGPFLYILKGALTEQQGQIPEGAFEGEEAVFGDDDLANELFEPVSENLPDGFGSSPEAEGEPDAMEEQGTEDAAERAVVPGGASPGEAVPAATASGGPTEGDPPARSPKTGT